MNSDSERRTRSIRRALAGVLAAAAILGNGSSAQDAPSARVATIGGLMWTTATNGDDVAWSDANEHCATLELGGHDDWRLPALAELESLYDRGADARGRIVSPIELDDCCVWSATNLAELDAEAKGVLPDPANDRSNYYWGFLFPSGVRYYSFQGFPDGQALCVRDPG
jgi:hypothetical protein